MANPSRKILLAIDTCTRRASIALRDETLLLGESTWICERQHTAAISAHIHMLIEASQISVNDIGAVAIAIGPGSFTGVRCGLAIAKGMAVANQLPLIGISAFQAIVQAQPNYGLPIYAVVEAGRNRVAVCRYERIEHAPLFESALGGVGDWQIYDHKQFSAQVTGPSWVCGDLPAPLLKPLAQVAQVQIAPTWLNLRRAGVLADLGYERWQRGDVDDAATLKPIYPPEES